MNIEAKQIDDLPTSRNPIRFLSHPVHLPHISVVYSDDQHVRIHTENLREVANPKKTLKAKCYLKT